MQEKLTIEVWENPQQNKALAELIETIINEFGELIPSGPVTGLKPVKVINDPIAGPTLYWPLNDKQYMVGLNCKPGAYAKAVFQFAQQLCHIYIDPRIKNWFIESICSLAGYYFLERFAHNPEFDYIRSQFSDDSLSFEDYYNKKIRFNYSDIDLVQHQHSSNWIKREIKKLQETRDWSNLTLNNMVAVELLPYFKDEKENWQLLLYIGKSSNPSPPPDSSDLSSSNLAIPDFDKFMAIVPENLKPVVGEMLRRIWD